MIYKSWEIQKEPTEEERKKIQQKNKETLEKNQDIIIEEIIETTEYLENGDKIIKKERKKHNISKQINETAKLLKIENMKKLQNILFGETEIEGE